MQNNPENFPTALLTHIRLTQLNIHYKTPVGYAYSSLYILSLHSFLLCNYTPFFLILQVFVGIMLPDRVESNEV